MYGESGSSTRGCVPCAPAESCSFAEPGAGRAAAAAGARRRRLPRRRLRVPEALQRQRGGLHPPATRLRMPSPAPLGTRRSRWRPAPPQPRDAPCCAALIAQHALACSAAPVAICPSANATSCLNSALGSRRLAARTRTRRHRRSGARRARGNDGACPGSGPSAPRGPTLLARVVVARENGRAAGSGASGPRVGDAVRSRRDGFERARDASLKMCSAVPHAGAPPVGPRGGDDAHETRRSTSAVESQMSVGRGAQFRGWSGPLTATGGGAADVWRRRRWGEKGRAAHGLEPGDSAPPA